MATVPLQLPGYQFRRKFKEIVLDGNDIGRLVDALASDKKQIAAKAILLLLLTEPDVMRLHMLARSTLI